jgi:hypothetical protein
MNATQRSLIVSISAVALLAVAADRAPAQIPDHLECYKIRDPLALQATVTLDSPQFGLDPNCKVGRAKLFCVPTKKTVIAAAAGNVPIVPLSFVGPNAGDRICYKVKCSLPSVPNTLVTDQFGTRVLERPLARMLCTPAVKGAVLPGWRGRIEFETPTPGFNGTQYWGDTDGVNPANPGCHYAFTDATCTTPIPPPPGPRFGEKCDAHTGYLIETNPDANVCHPHKKDVLDRPMGHPDVFDCDAYCKGTVAANAVGVCVVVANHCNFGVDSAYCSCNGAPPPP